MKTAAHAKKRLLFYNWAPFDDPRLPGGGVSVYLRNLLAELATRQDLDLFFLSVALRGNRPGRRPGLRETGNALSDKGVRSFEIVNAPLRVPGRRMAHTVDRWSCDFTTRDAVASLLTEFGAFDAFHIHNLEGISSEVLRLKDRFPDCRFFHTWHNYIPLCPQVHLLYRDREPCLDYKDGHSCVDCVGDRLPGPLRNVRSAVMPRPDRSRLRKAATYRAWRETNADLLNSCIDMDVAVARALETGDVLNEAFATGQEPPVFVHPPLGPSA